MKTPGMNPKILFAVFLASVTAMVITGFYAFKASERLTALFEQREQHFKLITMAAAQVTSYSKRAENHLFLYVMLHNPIDKGKFPKRIKSLNEYIAVLKEKSKSPKTTAIVNKIAANSGENLSLGNALIAFHDQAMSEKGEFKIDEHRELVLKLHQRFSQMRRLGVELTTLLIAKEDKRISEAHDRTGQLRLVLLLLAALAACLTLYTGYALSKMVSALNKEIATREKSEQELEIERDKLKEALAEIKNLSGLIPICSKCKKIRDDQGYWQQVETYIRDRSDAQFSHSLCPECALKLYPDIYKKILS